MRTKAHLTMGEHAVLDLIRSNPDVFTSKELADELLSTPNSITVIIVKLRANGYLITSPRYRFPRAPRAGVRQTYRLED